MMGGSGTVSVAAGMILGAEGVGRGVAEAGAALRWRRSTRFGPAVGIHDAFPER